ncbi:MAG: hypothetical protein ACRCZ2_00405, partial [Fusobacteriaceae bacterium]
AIKIKQFQNKYPGIDYPEYITRENSGVTEVENFSIQSLEGSIDRDIDEINKIIKEDRWMTGGRCRISWRASKKEEELESGELTESQLEILEKIDEIKKNIKGKIINYYMIQNSSKNRTATKTILQLAGFSPCSKCC